PRLRRSLAEETSWGLSLDEITPFLAVETTSGDGSARATRRCLLKVRLVGDVIDREQRGLSAMPIGRGRVRRCLAAPLGLDEPAPDHARKPELYTLASAIDGITATIHRRPPPPIVLFVPLVRAAGNDIDRILTVEQQVTKVLEIPNSEQLIPPEFQKMWKTVLDFTRARRRA